MENAKQLIDEYIASAEKILVQFSIDESSAVEALSHLKKRLGEKHTVSEDTRELFEACVYNALAAINSAPCQTKKSDQLIAFLTEAKEEMRIIGEML